MSQTTEPQVAESATGREATELGAPATFSPVLARLIEEVRYERARGPQAYNRMHNRHNRSR